LSETIQDILDEFGKTLVDDVRKSLNEKQAAKAARKGSSFNPNSRLAASIKYSVEYGNGGISMTFYMDKSYYWIDVGRKPGNVSQEGQESIMRWIKRKGLTPKLSDLRKKKIKGLKSKRVKKVFKQASIESKIKSFAFAIARKIQKKGYEGNLFWESVRYDGRVEILQKLINDQFEKDIDIIFKDVNE
jgi:hypothetical protein